MRLRLTDRESSVAASGSVGAHAHAHDPAAERVRPHLLEPQLAASLAETFKVLGDPTRVRILVALSHAELCVCDIASLLRLGESAVSHQLRILRSLRLVRARREGRMIFYALDDEHITRLLAQGLEHVSEAAAGVTSADQEVR